MSRRLLSELLTYLGHRQAETRSLVSRHSLATAARLEDLELRHARVAERLERVEADLQRLARDAGALRSLLRASLRAPRSPSSATAAPVGAATSAPAPNGHVADFTPGRVLLRVEHLAKEIGGADILSDISFEIYEHEILGLIGPNGAGKTTLMECLANLRPRTSGTFYEGDEAPPDWNPRRLLFYLPNGTAPYAELYTIEVLALFGKLFDVEPSRRERIIIDELALGPVLRKKVGALSKGNLQRLLMALALMSPQPLLALDEPFDGLDLHQTRAMMAILRGLRAQQRTLLLCIHQLNDAERICDRLLLLSAGRMVGIGTLDQLRAQAGLPEGSLEQVFLALTGASRAATPLARAATPSKMMSFS